MPPGEAGMGTRQALPAQEKVRDRLRADMAKAIPKTLKTGDKPVLKSHAPGSEAVRCANRTLLEEHNRTCALVAGAEWTTTNEPRKTEL